MEQTTPDRKPLLDTSRSPGVAKLIQAHMEYQSPDRKPVLASRSPHGASKLIDAAERVQLKQKVVQRLRKTKTKYDLLRGTTKVIRDPSNSPSEPSFVEGSLKLLCSSRLYLLLLLVPFALAPAPFGWSTAASFTVSCLGILPLAALLGAATEQISHHTSDTLSGLLNATFGNATELIVSFFALRRGLLQVVQVSLLGSILSNTLLVLGCACFAGGLTQHNPSFSRVASKENATMLQIAVLGLMVPTLLFSVGQLKKGDATDLSLSRGLAVALLLLYFLYLYFQLVTHRDDFEEEPSPPPERSKVSEMPSENTSEKTSEMEGAMSFTAAAAEEAALEEEEEVEETLLTLGGALSWLCAATILIAGDWMACACRARMCSFTPHVHWQFCPSRSPALSKGRPRAGGSARRSWASWCFLSWATPPSTRPRLPWHTKKKWTWPSDARSGLRRRLLSLSFH